MLLHRLEFFFRQCVRLPQNSVGDTDFADIMYQSRNLHRALRFRAESKLLGNMQAVGENVF